MAVFVPGIGVVNVDTTVSLPGGAIVDNTTGGLSAATVSGSQVEAADTSTGTITVVVEASGSVVENVDTSSGTIAVVISLSGTSSEADDTSAGVLGSAVSRTVGGTASEGGDSSTGDITVLASVSGATAEASDTVAGTLALLAAVSGTTSESGDTSTGTLIHAGPRELSGTAAEAADTSSGFVSRPSEITVGGTGGYIRSPEGFYEFTETGFNEFINYVRQELISIETELTLPSLRGVRLETRHAAPEYVQEGLLVKADGTDWDPGSGAGVYVYQNYAWVKL